MTHDGRVFYYSDYQVDGAEKHNTEPGWCWSCCTGTRPQAIADYANQVYLRDADSLYVNLFTPATVTWVTGGRRVVVRQETRFPEHAATELTVSTGQPAAFAIKLRSPQWLARPMAATVNGQAAPLAVDSRHWATLRREWRDGDKLLVTLPRDLTASSLDPTRPYPAAISCGPVVLAFQAPDSSLLRQIDLAHPGRWLTPVAGEPLTWQLRDHPRVLARPFYAYHEGEPYYLYFDPQDPGDAAQRRIEYHGRWLDAERFRFSNEVGATLRYAFQGRGVRWLGFKFDDAGRAEVSLDGKPVAVVDQYGPGRGPPFDWSRGGLAPGEHTIQLKVLAEKSDQSKGRFINVAGFQATD